MATDKSELARLRADVKRQQRLVRAKMGRAEKNYRVDWDLKSNKSVAPIADLKKVNRYTATQLKSVLKKQSDFLSRKTILRPDARGRILPSNLVAENLKLDKQFYEKAQRQWAKFKDIPAYHHEERFGDGQTLDDIRKQRTPDWGLGAHDMSDSIGNVQRRKTFGSIRDADALKKLNKTLAERLADKQFWQHRQDKIMNSVMDQLSLFGDIGLKIYDKVADMSPKARELLLTDRRFMDSLSASYERIKMGFQIPEGDSIEDVRLRNDLSDIDRRIRWAEDRVNYKPKKNIKRRK